MVFLKPIDEELLGKVAKNFKHIITVENGVITGGLGSAVLEYLADHNYTDIKVRRIGLPDEFVTHGSINELQHITGIDMNGILKDIIQLYNEIKGNERISYPLSEDRTPIDSIHDRLIAK